MDCTVKLGKKAKMVVEKDEDGKPRKWLELMAKEMEPARMPAVGAERVPPPAVAPPVACMAAPQVDQAAHVLMRAPVMPPPPAVLECVALQAPDQSNQPRGFRAVVEGGRIKFALQRGIATCDSMDFKLPTAQGRLQRYRSAQAQCRRRSDSGGSPLVPGMRGRSIPRRSSPPSRFRRAYAAHLSRSRPANRCRHCQPCPCGPG